MYLNSIYIQVYAITLYTDVYSEYNYNSLMTNDATSMYIHTSVHVHGYMHITFI